MRRNIGHWGVSSVVVLAMAGTGMAEVWDGTANGANAGQWATGGQTQNNWVSGTTPNAAGAVADFNMTALTGARNVLIASGMRAGQLNFNVTSGNGYVLSGGALNLDGAGSADAQINFLNTNTVNHTISATLTLVDNLQVNFGTSTSTLTLSGAISGAKTITASGSGTLIITTAQSYTGGTAINGGTVRAGHANALGTTGTISFGGGTLQYNGINTDLSDRFSNAGGQNYRIDTNGQNVAFANGLGSSNGSLNKLGNGVLTLNGASTYAGDTRVTGGTLRLGNSDRIGNTSRLVMAGGTFDANGHDEIVGTLQLTENSTIDMGSGDSVLQFDESFGETWTAGKVLQITNYDNNLEGTGVDRIYVGTASNGLTVAQLAQIEFVNPVGFAPGKYGAMMLDDGQVVAPEPASLGLIAAGAFGLLSRRRRRA